MKRILTFTLLLLSASMQAESSGDAEHPVPALNQAAERIRSSQGKPQTEDVELVLTQLETLIKEKRFSVSEHSGRTIYVASRAALTLVGSAQHIKKSDQALFAKTEAVLALYVEEISSNIDESWASLPVTANVCPPPGTKMAISGMDPEAIEDPVHRQGYLDKIAENQKNSQINAQQRVLRSALKHILFLIGNSANSPGSSWSKEEAVRLFGKRKTNRDVIEQYTK